VGAEGKFWGKKPSEGLILTRRQIQNGSQWTEKHANRSGKGTRAAGLSCSSRHTEGVGPREQTGETGYEAFFFREHGSDGETIDENKI